MGPWSAARVHVTSALTAVVLVAAFWAAPRPWTGAVIALASALAVVALVAVLRGRPVPDPAPWWLVTLALGALTVHNVESLRHVALLGHPRGSGPVFDLSLPLGYAALLVAAMVVVFRYARRDAGGVIEAVLVAVGAASLMWALLLEPALTRADAPAGRRVYVLVVVLLITGIAGAVVRAALVSREARGTLGYLLVAVASILVGNAGAVLTADPQTQVAARWVGAVWVLGYLGLAAAALHPSLVHLATPGRPLVSRLTDRRLVFLGATLALNPALAALQHMRGYEIDASLLLVASVLVVPLALARVAGLVRLQTATEAELARLATRDELTGLPNRRAIDLHLEESVDRVRAGLSAGVLVLFLDLDDFKAVNDAHGHGTGDELLVTVARRLRAAVREHDVVGRFGGDEFVVVAEGDPDDLRASAVARVVEALDAPVRLGPVTASARASIGTVAARSGEPVTAAQLLSAADASMYDRKREVRARRGEDAPSRASVDGVPAEP
ncbi:GGDEF domain-containing protein [Cellulomonas sp. APG4]|uniref:GGDEF domain-containing protein n=1 Tax=Cellulomonas sp. APG4 TaxID=1538656 RepID=UPI00137A742C|nr:GGDEF domain-containing protein [Cellulomonas sp. APG4]NCT89603.1 GGDEF domain-containing protein [Cellulomonas sp. APG4]